MRLAAAALLTTALMACSSTTAQVKASPTPHALNPSPTSSACPLGDTIRVDISLGLADNGRSVTAHLCAVIAVHVDDLSARSPTSSWRQIQSSDDAVLTIVPLPLPAGDYWFQAKRTGSADLFAEDPTTPCPASGCSTVGWRVHVTFVP